MYPPTVIENVGRSERAYDIFSRLMKDRIIMLSTEIVDQVASIVCAQLLFLESQDPEKEINIYINSPGGSVSAGMAIYDTMNYISAPVSTVCMGMAASMGAFLLAAGEKGKRYALPNSRIMIHQPLGGYSGQASDVEIHARELLKMKENLSRILAENTGKSYEQIVEATERDNYLTSQEALEFGLIDKVLVSRKDVGEAKDNKDK